MPISNDTFSEWATTRQIEPIIYIRERTLYRLRQSGVSSGVLS